MAAKTLKRPTLNDYLALQYPFNVVADEEGGYVVIFPDLPGCMTQAETIDEIPEMAEEARRLWIESESEMGRDIPRPSYPEEYSGKFVVRIPKSLHRRLVEKASSEGVSLNQYVSGLLERRDALTQIEHRLDEFESTIASVQPALRVQVSGMHLKPTRGRPALRALDASAVAA